VPDSQAREAVAGLTPESVKTITLHGYYFDGRFSATLRNPTYPVPVSTPVTIRDKGVIKTFLYALRNGTTYTTRYRGPGSLLTLEVVPPPGQPAGTARLIEVGIQPEDVNYNGVEFQRALRVLGTHLARQTAHQVRAAEREGPVTEILVQSTGGEYIRLTSATKAKEIARLLEELKRLNNTSFDWTQDSQDIFLTLTTVTTVTVRNRKPGHPANALSADKADTDDKAVQPEKTRSVSVLRLHVPTRQFYMSSTAKPLPASPTKPLPASPTLKDLVEAVAYEKGMYR
jgi:hypothetical protein